MSAVNLSQAYMPAPTGLVFLLKRRSRVYDGEYGLGRLVISEDTIGFRAAALTMKAQVMDIDMIVVMIFLKNLRSLGGSFGYECLHFERSCCRDRGRDLDFCMTPHCDFGS